MALLKILWDLHNMGKTIDEIHAMLIEYEKVLPKKAETPQVMMIKNGKIQKANKKSLNAKGKNKVNGKERIRKDIRKEPVLCILAEFAEEKECNWLCQFLGIECKLKHKDLYLYVGYGVRAQVGSNWKNPGEPHWTAVKNILKYLRNTKDMVLVYGENPSIELRLECYCDDGFETDRR
ncbi:hypothetical protein Tco_0689731 [Tanacetum coccineum]